MKYIIDVPDGTKWIEAYYAVDHFQYQGKSIIADSLIPYTEPDRKAIEDEVWRFAWEVLQLDLPVFREIFGYDTVKMDYRNFKYKYEAWLKQKDDNAIKQKVIELADEIGIHNLYSLVKEIRGE